MTEAAGFATGDFLTTGALDLTAPDLLADAGFLAAGFVAVDFAGAADLAEPVLAVTEPGALFNGALALTAALFTLATTFSAL